MVGWFHYETPFCKEDNGVRLQHVTLVSNCFKLRRCHLHAHPTKALTGVDCSSAHLVKPRVSTEIAFYFSMIRNLKIILIVAITTVGLTARAHQESADESLSLSDTQRQTRLSHAHELLGKYYKGSSVQSGERVNKINSKIYLWTLERLPKKYKKQYKKIAQAVIDQGAKYQFDPVFLLSVIQNESKFDPNRLGSLDEIGLMQIRPSTAKWITEKFDLKFKGDASLHDPIENIKIGAAYMNYLRNRFDSHAQLYISAYNMGKRNVDHALKNNVWPKDYANAVMRFYIDFYSEIRDAQHKVKAVKFAAI